MYRSMALMVFVDVHLQSHLSVQLRSLGVSFSEPSVSADDVHHVGRCLLRHGVTSFVPTVVSSIPDVYAAVLPKLRPYSGSPSAGATLLGVHLEGSSPFSAMLHPPNCFHQGRSLTRLSMEHMIRLSCVIQQMEWRGILGVVGNETSSYPQCGVFSLMEVYGRDLSDIAIMTMAIELPGAIEAMAETRKAFPNIAFSIGHSVATIEDCRLAIEAGAVRALA